MPVRWKPKRSKHRSGTRRPSGCRWCRESQDPPEGHEICGECAKGFKRALCSRQWSRCREAFLSQRPECVCGCGELAEEVDHIEDWRYRPSLFWWEHNWQGLTKSCHSKKTRRTQLRRTGHIEEDGTLRSQIRKELRDGLGKKL